MYLVFVSSTRLDLTHHRLAVMKALTEAGLHPIGMENFGSQNGDAEQVSMGELERADLFIGLYARRYGYRPTDDRSITEMEYETAKEKDIPRLAFIIDDDYHDEYIDQHAETNDEAKMLLNMLVRRLKAERAWEPFTTPQDLAVKVQRDALRHFAMQIKNTAQKEKRTRGNTLFGNVTATNFIAGDANGSTFNNNVPRNEPDDK